MKNIALIDNAAYSFSFQIDNGVPILPFYHNKEDYQLAYLEKYLLQMRDQNIRDLNAKTFKFDLYKENDTVDEIIHALFPEIFDVDSSEEWSNEKTSNL